MRIKVINPNTTAGMTAKIGEAARRVAAPGTEIVAVNPAAGPVSIESHYDEAVSVLGVLEEVRKGEAEGVDGHVIACFGDPGLLAAREIAKGPVLGIAEAAMHAASFVATGFSVVTTLTRTCVIAEHLVERYGMTPFCRKVRGTDIPVLDLEDTGTRAFATIVEECRRAVAEDRCGAIVLGCAGMADLVAAVQREAGRAGDRRRRGRGQAGGGAGRPRARHEQARRPRLADAQALRRQPRPPGAGRARPVKPRPGIWGGLTMDDTKTSRRRLLAGAGAAALLAGRPALAQEQQTPPAGQPPAQPAASGQAPAAGGKVLKIGVLGVMRGPAASWGLVNKYCAEATAQMYNEQGGVEIGGEKYKIEIAQHRRPARPQARRRGRGAAAARGRSTTSWARTSTPPRRASCRCCGRSNAVNVAYAFAQVPLHAAAAQLDPRHGRVLPGRPDHLQVPEEEQGREGGQLRRPQRGGLRSTSATRAWRGARRTGLTVISASRTPTSRARPTSAR